MNLHGGNIRFYKEKYNLKNIIDFSANINPLGFPQSVKDVIINNISSLVHYPDPECKNLAKQLSANLGIHPENVLVGNGATEIIYLAAKAINPETTLICLPTFSEYEKSVKQVGSKTVYITANKRENFKIDIEKIIKHVPETDLIFLCNPNNPTGYLVPQKDIVRLVKECEKHKKYLVVDEAFIDWVDDEQKFDSIRQASSKKYLIVLRSLTKFFGLPGIRLGYCVANKKLIEKLSQVQYTWTVNSLAQAIGEKMVSDKSFIKKTKIFIKNEKRFLCNGLQKISFIKSYISSANYVLCEITDKKVTAAELTEKLARKGILIRDCSNFKGLSNKYFRIAVKNRKDNVRLINELKKYTIL